MVADWLETLVDTIHHPKNKSSLIYVMLLVLFIGAGSLYVLLNTPE